MKKIITLQEFLDQRKELKPTEAELQCGRFKTKNGFTYVAIKENNTYNTWDNKSFASMQSKNVITVRG